MKIETFLEQFEKAVEGTEAGTLRTDTKFRDLAQWDSLAALNILAMVSLEYDVELDAAALRACQTVEDVFQTVQARKNS